MNNQEKKERKEYGSPMFELVSSPSRCPVHHVKTMKKNPPKKKKLKENLVIVFWWYKNVKNCRLPI